MKRRLCWWCGRLLQMSALNFPDVTCISCGQRTPVASRQVLTTGDYMLLGGERVGDVRCNKDCKWEARRNGEGCKPTTHQTRWAAALWLRRQVANWLYRNVGG